MPLHSFYQRAVTDDRVSLETVEEVTDVPETQLAQYAKELEEDDPLHDENEALILTTSHWRTWLRRILAVRKRWSSAKEVDIKDTSTPALAQPRSNPPSTGIKCLLFPLPSWSHRFLGYPMTDEPPRSTDYLDGLRGVASLFVFFNHYMLGGSDQLAAFGFGEAHHWNLLQLPFVRTLFSGAAMVAIFFVISGYVLSARCVAAMRAGQQEQLHTALTSMAFRRPVRLFLPSIIISAVELGASSLGLRGPRRPLHVELHRYRTFLMDYLFMFWDWQDPLRLFGGPDWKGWFGGQLWTIPKEFTCSMILFVAIMGFARCSVKIRLFLETLLITCLFYVKRWDIALFIAGMTLAEVQQIVEGHRIPLVVQIFLWLALFVGWFLTGLPRWDESHTPGYSFLSQSFAIGSLDNWRFWLGIAGILVVGCLTFLPLAQRAFTTRPARYLGKISYALYLVHELLNSTLRNALWEALDVLPHSHLRNNPLTWKWLFSTVVYVPCVLWAADIFWRLIDRPVVRFAHWVESKCFIQHQCSK